MEALTLENPPPLQIWQLIATLPFYHVTSKVLRVGTKRVVLVPLPKINPHPTGHSFTKSVYRIMSGIVGITVVYYGPHFSDHSVRSDAHYGTAAGSPGHGMKMGAVSPRRMPLMPVSQQCPSPGAVWRDSQRDIVKPVYCTIPTSQDLDCQWVLPETQFEVSSSPEVLHLCDVCDAEFSSVSDLAVHSRKCRKPAPFQPRTVAKKSLSIHVWNKHSNNKFNGGKVTKRKANPIKPRLATTVVNNRIHNFHAKPILPSPPKLSPPTKGEYMESLGLMNLTKLKKKVSKYTENPPLSNQAQIALYRRMPFTLLPKEVRLRSYSFMPSSRMEDFNKEQIKHSWQAIDKFCPAYPANHKKFQDYSAMVPPPSCIERPVKPKKVLLGPRTQALKLLQLRGEPLVVLRKLTAWDIQLALDGGNTQELLVKYAAARKTQEKSRRGRKPKPKLRKPAAPSSPSTDPAVAGPSHLHEGKSYETPNIVQQPDTSAKSKRLSQGSVDADVGKIELNVSLQHVQSCPETSPSLPKDDFGAEWRTALQPVVRLRRLEVTRLHPLTTPCTEKQPI
ncbi:hypothetical protein B566_EDAN013531 [Ephemera danica]|nr:hypothetical protein B566_EDAN013531 [Ephemera danica]